MPSSLITPLNTVTSYHGNYQASSRRPSAGTILALVFVLVATLTVLFSLLCLRSFLHQINTEAKEAFQGFSKRETRRRKMHEFEQIHATDFASECTLPVGFCFIGENSKLWEFIGFLCSGHVTYQIWS